MSLFYFLKKCKCCNYKQIDEVFWDFFCFPTWVLRYVDLKSQQLAAYSSLCTAPVFLYIFSDLCIEYPFLKEDCDIIIAHLLYEKIDESNEATFYPPSKLILIWFPLYFIIFRFFIFLYIFIYHLFLLCAWVPGGPRVLTYKWIPFKL